MLSERKQLARDVDLDDDDRALRGDAAGQPAAARRRPRSASWPTYDWQSSDAREDYEKIKDLLGREMLDQRFAGMKQALENATDEDRAAINEMLSDLNDLLEKHRRGEDTDQEFADFMDKHGDFFPENPQNVDELIDALAQRAAAAQRMLNSMTQEQRDELDAPGAAGLRLTGADGVSSSQLDANLQSLRPGEDWGGSERFDGEQGLGLGDGTGVLQDLADLDDLAEQLAQSYDGARMDDVDLDKLARQLGDEAAVDARTLAAARAGAARLRLPQAQLRRAAPARRRKAMRQLGKALLKDVADRMSGRQGQRDLRHAGAAGERSGATREWAFGDTEPWDVTRTDHQRRGPHRGRGRRPGAPAYASRSATSRSIETEARTQAAVALLGRHVVLDGDGRPLGADEAHRAGAAHADLSRGSAATRCS